MLSEIRNNVKETHPLIHCITNPISINQCANAILAAGARPVMAEHTEEVAEITKTADALMLNIGNITDVRMKSMELSAQVAIEKKIPFILDAVGVSCSRFRKKFAIGLIEKYKPTVVKGNYSEIMALCCTDYSAAGVDSACVDLQTVSKEASEFAHQYNCVVLASGKTDIITDGKRIIYMKNGTPQLASLTGTGCMLGALCATYLSVSSAVDAAKTACAVLGICGELSQTENGNGIFFVQLMDNLTTLTDAVLNDHIETEEVRIEKI